MRNDNQWVWVKYSVLICLILAMAGLARLTWWSFLQTRDWFSFLDYTGKYVGLSMAVIFQYGQSPVLFLRGLLVLRKMVLENQIQRAQRDEMRLKILEQDVKNIFMGIVATSIVFAAFAGVDAWTNVKQMMVNVKDLQFQGMVITQDKYILIWVIGVIAVFFEELLGACLSMACHIFNDIRVIHGKKRVTWMDIFADQARNITGIPDKPRPFIPNETKRPAQPAQPARSERPENKPRFVPQNYHNDENIPPWLQPKK